MKKGIFIVAGIILVLGTSQGCKKKKSAVAVSETNSASGTPSAQSMQSEVGMSEVNISPTYTWPGMVDPFNIESTGISGDTLFVVVSYGGGCEKHDFTMNTSMMWMKSNPPQLNVYIEHNSHGDKCRAMIQETLAFNLKPLRYKEKGAVRFILNNNRENTVLYEY